MANKKDKDDPLIIRDPGPPASLSGHGDLPGQKLLFPTGEPVRREPTQEELETALEEKCKIVIWRWHRGRPPKGMDWSDLFQEVKFRTLERIKKFMHGGKFTLGEFVYVAACFALCDIQREDLRTQRPPPDYPLLDKMV